jgi:hypothetical protein
VSQCPSRLRLTLTFLKYSYTRTQVNREPQAFCRMPSCFVRFFLKLSLSNIYSNTLVHTRLPPPPSIHIKRERLQDEHLRYSNEAYKFILGIVLF